jgi:hypothetical protein
MTTSKQPAKQTEVKAIEFAGPDGAGTIVTEVAMTELSEADLDGVSGGASRSSDANFDRHRVAMSGKNFAGPDGAGSSFDLKTEDTSSGSTDFLSE